MKNYWDSEIEKFDKIYDGEKTAVDRFVDRFREDVIKERAEVFYAMAQSLEQGAVLVDIGCGTGRQAMHLAAMGYKVRAFDISQRAIEMAKHRLEGHDLDITYEVADVAQIEYPDCDCVFGLGLMDYLTDSQVNAILSQVKKLDCKFAFSLPFRCLKSYVRSIYRAISGTKIYLRTQDDVSRLSNDAHIDNIQFVTEGLGACLLVHNFDRQSAGRQ